MVAAPRRRIDLHPVGLEREPAPGRRTHKGIRIRPRAQVAWLALCVVLMAWQCLAQQATLLELHYRIDGLRAEGEALNQQILRLTLEKARLASLTRVEQVARTQLGMVDPGPVRVVRLAPTSPGSVRLPAVAQTAPHEGSWWERVLARILPGNGVAEALDEQRP